MSVRREKREEGRRGRLGIKFQEICYLSLSEREIRDMSLTRKQMESREGLKDTGVFLGERRPNLVSLQTRFVSDSEADNEIVREKKDN